MEDKLERSIIQNPNSFILSTKEAFSGWLSIFGIIGGVLTLFNFLRKALEIGVASSLAPIISAYQEAIHEPVSAFFGILGMSLSSLMIDVIILWVIISGIVIRSFLPIWKSILKTGMYFFLPNRYFPRFLTDGLGKSLRYKGMIPVILILAVMFWPILMALMLSSRYVAKNPVAGFVLVTNGKEEATLPTYQFLYDYRILIMVQITALLIATFVLIIVNEILPE